MRRRTVLTLVPVAGIAAMSSFERRESYEPPEGFIPDAKTAVRVAEAVLSPIYGEEQIASERPFSARLRGGVWTVSGHLPEDAVGGVAEIKIAKKTGCIHSVIHYK